MNYQASDMTNGNPAPPEPNPVFAPYSTGDEDFSPKVDVIDGLFAKATIEVKRKVHTWGTQLFQSLSKLVPARYETGWALACLKRQCEQEQIQWQTFCDQINWQRRTADLYIEQYVEANKVDETLRSEALRRGYDLAEKKYEELRSALQKVTLNEYYRARAHLYSTSS